MKIKSVAFWLFVIFLAFYTLTMSGHLYSIDDIMKLEVTKNIIEKGTIAIAIPGLGNYSPFPIGQSIVWIPFYLIARYSASLAPPGLSEHIIEFCVSWYNVPITALMIMCIFLLLISLGFNKKSSLATCIIVGLGTIIFPYSKQAWSEPTVGLLLIISLLVFNKYIKRPGVIKAFFIGIIIGLSGTFRHETIILSLPFIIAILIVPKDIGTRSRLVHLLFFSLGIMIFWSFNLLYNYARYGNIFTTGYPAVVSALTTPGTYSGVRFLRGLGRLLFSLSKSVIIFSVPIILFFFSIRRFYSRNRAFTLVLVSIIIMVVTFFSFVGGSSWAWGERYLVYIVPLFLVPVVALIQNSSRWVKRLIWTTFVLGFLINLLGVSVSHTVVMEKILEEHGEDVLIESYSAVFPPPVSSTLFVASREFLHYIRGSNLMRCAGPTDREIRYNTFDFWFTLAYFKGMPIIMIIAGLVSCLGILCFAVWRLRESLKKPED